MAQRAGMGVEAYQEYAYAAKMADIEQQVFDKSTAKLAKNMSDAASGKNKSLADLFSRLHIKAKNADGSLRNVADVLPELADGFKRQTNATVRQTMAMALFGEEGASMVDLLGQGADAMAKAREEARKYGILTEEQIKQAAQLDTGLKHVSMAVSGLWKLIGAKLAPVMTPLLEMFGDWVALNRVWLATNIESAVTGVVDALKDFDWKAWGQTLLSLGRTVNWLVGYIGGWKTVLAATVVLISGSFLLSLGKLVWELALVGKSILVVGARLGTLAFGAVAGAVLNFATALRAGYGAMAALNLVMAANPVGAIIIGITALIAVGVLLWKNWDAVKAAWTGLSSWIMSGIDSLIAKFKPLIDVLKTVIKYSPVGIAMRAGQAIAGMGRGPSTSNPVAGLNRFGGAPSTPRLSPAASQIGRRGGGVDTSSDVNVTMDFKNVPHGAKTEVKSDGPARTKVNVGRAMMQPG